jgi:2-keto-4-pentenoate hydratase/2-oxohepta-3-ene-1,7-dioic acid hydratase in catechol pathway
MEKPSSAQPGGASLVGHNAKLAPPAASGHFDCEPALVFVVGRKAFGVTSEDEAMDYVVGVTLLGELTARDARDPGCGWGAIGPELITLDEIGDPDELWLTCTVNGDERLRVSAHDQVSRMGGILERFSHDEPFEPGDMFSTGAPRGAAADARAAAPLQAGDVIECSIEGITTLRTTILAA